MNLPPDVYRDPESRGSCRFAREFAAGLGGVDVLDVPSGPAALPLGGVAIFPSPRAWPFVEWLRASGYPWYYADHGYFGRRLYYRITRNGFQYQGQPRRDRCRFDGFGRRIKPWRETGAHVLVCPNGAMHFGLHGAPPLPEWLAQVRAELRRHTDREIRVRLKPRGFTASRAEPIDEALDDCWVCVTYSSNAAVDALVEGVPVVTLADFAASYRMGRTSIADVEDPYYPPDRGPFLAALAAQQWSVHEIRNGTAWADLQRN